MDNGKTMNNNLTVQEKKLVDQYLKNKAKSKEYREKNKEKLSRKQKERYHARKKIIDPETGLSLKQLDQKRHWANYKKNNPDWRKRRATYQKKYKEENLDIIRLKDKLKAREPERKAAILNARRLRVYGVSANDYDKMFKEQNGVCFICNKPQRKKVHKHLFVDHCHTTNKIRALLCNNCNTGIGMFEESIQTMKDAIAYLELFNKNNSDEMDKGEA